MEHFVVQHVLDHEAWDGGTVERPADDDRPMDVIVVAQHSPGWALTPRKQGTLKTTIEVASIERRE